MDLKAEAATADGLGGGDRPGSIIIHDYLPPSTAAAKEERPPSIAGTTNISSMDSDSVDKDALGIVDAGQMQEFSRIVDGLPLPPPLDRRGEGSTQRALFSSTPTNGSPYASTSPRLHGFPSNQEGSSSRGDYTFLAGSYNNTSSRDASAFKRNIQGSPFEPARKTASMGGHSRATSSQRGFVGAQPERGISSAVSALRTNYPASSTYFLTVVPPTE